MEWDYGEYNGLVTAEILNRRRDWDLFRDGCPGGESPTQIAERADRVVERVRAVGADVLLFSSAHFIRVLTARWLALGPNAARYFLLNPASLSAVGYENDFSRPVIRLWNDDHHVTAENPSAGYRIEVETAEPSLVRHAERVNSESSSGADVR